MDTIDQEDLDTLDINHSELKLPEDDTTYWCSVHKLPDTFINKHHAIQVSFKVTRLIQYVVTDKFGINRLIT